MLDQASTIINVCARITNYVFIMKRVAGQFNSPLATWSFLIKLFFNVTRYMKYLGYGSFPVTAITDENYRRSEIMAKASEDADAQDQVGH